MVVVVSFDCYYYYCKSRILWASAVAGWLIEKLLPYGLSLHKKESVFKCLIEVVRNAQDINISVQRIYAVNSETHMCPPGAPNAHATAGNFIRMSWLLHKKGLPASLISHFAQMHHEEEVWFTKKKNVFPLSGSGMGWIISCGKIYVVQDSQTHLTSHISAFSSGNTPGLVRN